MKKLLVTLIALLVLALAMAVTCPDQESLVRHIGHSKAGEGKVLGQAKASALAVQARLTSDYHDRVLFATATIRQGTRRECYLGLFNTWIKLPGGNRSKLRSAGSELTGPAEQQVRPPKTLL